MLRISWALCLFSAVVTFGSQQTTSPSEQNKKELLVDVIAEIKKSAVAVNKIAEGLQSLKNVAGTVEEPSIFTYFIIFIVRKIQLKIE